MSQFETIIKDARSLDLQDFVEAYAHPVLIMSIADTTMLKEKGDTKRTARTVMNSFPLSVFSNHDDEEEQKKPRTKSTMMLGWLRKDFGDQSESLVTLGRAVNNDVRLPLQTVSKTHALFMKVRDKWRVSHPGVTNGLFVNGLPIPAGEFKVIRCGDVLGFGPDVRATFFTPQGLYSQFHEISERDPAAEASHWFYVEEEKAAMEVTCWLRAKTDYLALSFKTAQELGREILWIKALDVGSYPQRPGVEGLDEEMAQAHMAHALEHFISMLERQGVIAGGKLIDLARNRRYYTDRLRPLWLWCLDGPSGTGVESAKISLRKVYEDGEDAVDEDDL